MSASPTPSPRRPSFAGPSSPRFQRAAIPSRLPSISASQPFELEPVQVQGQGRNVVHGFSPPPNTTSLDPASPRQQPLLSLNTAGHYRARLSPQLTTPVEQTFQYAYPPEGSSSPRPYPDRIPIRSRRNSAIVSISLSSRSRSHTPRGNTAALPGNSGQATPSKGSSSATPRGDAKEMLVNMGDPSVQEIEEMDEWQPVGGMLLDEDEDEDEAVEEGEGFQGRAWTGASQGSQVVQDVLSPGMVFGEGLEFQGEIVVPAVGRLGIGDDEGLPLRRGGSEVGKPVRADGRPREGPKMTYETVRRLGSGSYAVVYLVRERGGRKREYALKCLSKQDLEEEQLETQLFEATIHLSLPIHTNIVTLHQTLQTKKWLFLMLELCPGEDLFFWLEKSRDASPPTIPHQLREEPMEYLSSSKFSSSSIPFSSSQLFSGLSHTSPSFTASQSPVTALSSKHSASPASLLFAHHNGGGHHFSPSQTPPTPSLLSAFSANTLLSTRRLRLIAAMFSQMCEAVAVCHSAGVSHRDIKPENFICCDSIELEEAGEELDFGPQAKRKVVVKLTDFGLATTEEESGDVECGSKPYMSYECRNNLGPTYTPAQADVWSLGIVLINMLFHRNPWKDPTYDDINFDNFLNDNVNFLLSKFTGIGRDVATYLSEHVLCVEVDQRVTAKAFGKWIKDLPEMIGGRKAMSQLKMARLENKSTDKSLFVKSPVGEGERGRKASPSALTNSAPTLSGLPPVSASAQPHITAPSQLGTSTLPTPDLDKDDLRSATTVDGELTPADSSQYPSPTSADPDDPHGDDSRSLSTHKRRKRGVRKGKAAQAALAAASGADKPSQEERDSLLAELAAASQLLARDLSSTSRVDFSGTREEDFPPLGTSPAAAAAAKKSKWKDLMKMSSGNPELAALARRVAERDAGSGGNWSAPAKMQNDPSKAISKPAFKQTATMSSGISSALSSFGPVSSATSSSGCAEDDDWRAKEKEKPRGREHGGHGNGRRHEDTSRARKAAIAAAAITGNMDSMGSFGLGRKPIQNTAVNYTTHAMAPPQPQRPPVRSHLSQSSGPVEPRPLGDPIPIPPGIPIKQPVQTSVETVRPSLSSAESSSTILAPEVASPNKPKLKGQIQSLAKMLSGLKTKGKD